MSIAYPFQIEGAYGEFDAISNGYLFNVTIKLTDVPGDNDVAQMMNALTDPNVPLIGTDLSGVRLDLTGCWLRNINVLPLGNHQWRANLKYAHSPYSGVQISTMSQVSQIESNKDIYGDAVTLVYDFPTTYGGDAPTPRQEELRGTQSGEQGGTYQRLVPESTRVYTIRQPIDGDVIARQFIGTTNQYAWQGGAAGTWMLSSVTGETDNSNQLIPEWVNTYTFQYRADGWDPEVIFNDPLTNEPVPDPVLGDSKVIVEAYNRKDFSFLFPAI